MTPPKTPELMQRYRIAVVAKRLGVTPETVLDWCRQGLFGPRGEGWVCLNPGLRSPHYAITDAGLRAYEAAVSKWERSA